MRAKEIDEPAAGQGNVVQYTSEINSIGHNEQPREPFREVAQMIQVRGQPTEKDMTEGRSAGRFVDPCVLPYAP